MPQNLVFWLLFWLNHSGGSGFEWSEIHYIVKAGENCDKALYKGGMA